MKWIGVLLNSAHDVLDGRYGSQRSDPEPPPAEDFDEDLDRDDVYEGD